MVFVVKQWLYNWLLIDQIACLLNMYYNKTMVNFHKGQAC